MTMGREGYGYRMSKLFCCCWLSILPPIHPSFSLVC